MPLCRNEPVFRACTGVCQKTLRLVRDIFARILSPLAPREPLRLARRAMVELLPHVNAALNGVAGTLLITGWFFIRAGREDRHRLCMASAFGCSVLFLASYLTRVVASGPSCSETWIVASPSPSEETQPVGLTSMMPSVETR